MIEDVNLQNIKTAFEQGQRFYRAFSEGLASIQEIEKLGALTAQAETKLKETEDKLAELEREFTDTEELHVELTDKMKADVTLIHEKGAAEFKVLQDKEQVVLDKIKEDVSKSVTELEIAVKALEDVSGLLVAKREELTAVEKAIAVHKDSLAKIIGSI